MTYNTFLRKIIQAAIVASAAATVINPPAHADATLMDFNEVGAGGTSWPGWTYRTTSPYVLPDTPQWQRNDAKSYEQSDGGWLPALKPEESHYNDADSRIDTTQRAPSTSSGASLKVYDTGDSKYHAASYFFAWNNNFGSLGYADASTNRLSFYYKITGINPPNYAIGKNGFIPYYNNVDIGTYHCWPGGASGGYGCPSEAGNTHYYHRLSVNPDAWLHVQLDTHPDWLRNVGHPGDNPDPSHPYYQYMPRFYVQTASDENNFTHTNLTAFWIDEIKLWTQTQPENSISICSVWIGYWPETGKWQVGFHDLSDGLAPQGRSKFEIRWSISPITNKNWSSANTIVPEYWRVGSTNSFRLIDDWYAVVWTRFTLPAGTEANNNKIYFAIKDMSDTADGDRHNAPTTNIRTIDYDIRPSTGSSQLVAPTNLQIK